MLITDLGANHVVSDADLVSCSCNEELDNVDWPIRIYRSAEWNIDGANTMEIPLQVDTITGAKYNQFAYFRDDLT